LTQERLYLHPVHLDTLEMDSDGVAGPYGLNYSRLETET